MITSEQYKAIIGTFDMNKLEALNYAMNKFNINTALRISHFLAQILHESMGLKVMKENLNYSAKGLRITFKKYFINDDMAKAFERNPAKIANKVYANRMGNGDEGSGDGYRYIGRGFIQITGKDNYRILSNSLGIDFLNSPSLLERIDNAALSAAWFWNHRHLNDYADKNDIVGITKRVNGGLNGLEDRKQKLIKVKSILT